jgi:aryl-alcohol dehydrogenase-like predicted oxidoreductase
MSTFDRRQFLARTAAAFAAAAAARRALGQEAGATPVPPPQDPQQQQPLGQGAAERALELRELGSTGRRLPRLGLGCAALATIKSEEKAIALVRRAHELGIRYFDVPPEAGDGRAEEIVGRALEGAKREELFLAGRSGERKADAARRELEKSLARLKTTYVDAVLIAATKDREAASEPDSLLDFLQKAKREQLVRHIGITSSKGTTYAKRAMQRFPYELALIPMNPSDPERGRFAAEFLPFATEKKVGVVAMQVFLSRKGGEDLIAKKDCVVYALAHPKVEVIVPGCGSIEALEEIHAAAAGFVQPPDEWLRDLEKRAAALGEAAPAEDEGGGEKRGDGKGEK